MSPGTLYLVAWKFLWAVLLLYSVREVVGDTKHKIVCSIKNNQDPRNYLEKDVVDIAMKNITIHKGHSSNSWQVLNCTCEDKRVSLYFKVCITRIIPFWNPLARGLVWQVDILYVEWYALIYPAHQSFELINVVCVNFWSGGAWNAELMKKLKKMFLLDWKPLMLCLLACSNTS